MFRLGAQIDRRVVRRGHIIFGDAEVDSPLVVFLGGKAARYQGGIVFDAAPGGGGGGVAEDEFVCPGRVCGNGEQELAQADDRFFKTDRAGRPVIAPIIGPIIGRIAGDP